MKTYKTVLVGCGGISKSWLNACKDIPQVEICGLVDLNLENTKQKAEMYHLQNAFLSESLSEALNTCQPEVVFDITVPAAHKPVTLEALGFGCHVLGEKPMAERYEDACEMVIAARKAGKLYAVIQNRRYDKRVRTVEAALRSGVIGNLHTVNSDFYVGPHFGGFRDEMDHVLLLDMAIHTFDAARYLSGADATDVYCHEHNPAASWYRHGASATAVFQMTHGITYNYRGSWCAEGLPTTWECDWRFIGDKGTLLWDGKDEVRVETVSGTEGFIREVETVDMDWVDWDEDRNGHGGLIRDFINALDRGEPPLTHCEDNIRSLAMVFGAIESSVQGQKQPVPAHP